MIENNQPAKTSAASAVLAALRVNDVYSFRYNEHELKKRFSPYHCFDGQLVAKQRENGEFYFVDTYRGSKYDKFTTHGDMKRKSIQQALGEGTLTFICNLDEVDEIKEYETVYFDDDDFYNLSYQSGCYKYFVKKKDAIRSKEKMLQSIKKKIEETEYKRDSAIGFLEKLKQRLLKIENGDTGVYI
jgi:hypothetical protein